MSGRRVADIRQAWGVAAHERVVLTPARLAPGRGQQTMIEAAALIKGRGLDDVRFVLAGDAAKPAFARELDALAVKRGVQSMLVRVGAAADLPAAFIGAAVVVFPAATADGVTRTVDRGRGDGGADHHLRRRTGARDHRRAAVRGRRSAHRMARCSRATPPRLPRPSKPRLGSAPRRARPSGAGRGQRSLKPSRSSA